MLRKHLRLTSGLPLFFDLLTTVFSFFLIIPVHSILVKFYPIDRNILTIDYIALLPAIMLIWYVIFNLQKPFGKSRYTTLKDEISYVIKSVIIGEIGLLIILYSFHVTSVSGTYLWLFGIINVLLLILQKYSFLFGLDYVRRKGINRRKVLIVGDGENSRKLVDLIRKYGDWGIDIIGFVDGNGNQVGDEFCGSKILGKLKDLPAVLNSYYFEEVIFALPLSKLEEAKELVTLCESEGIQTRIISDFFGGLNANTEVDIVHGQPVISYFTTPQKHIALFIKRILDIVVSTIVLVILLPLFFIISLTIKLTSRGPTFYRWKVIGFNKKAFTGYKFRTMVANADELKGTLVLKNEMIGAAFKMKNDPRVTKVGRFLRKYSLDEIPQLISVIKGDMSLVGPRPPLETEIPLFKSWQRRKLTVKPGITCMWQCNGRNEINNFDEWVSLDLEYIDNWSLWLDIKILFKTIPAVFLGKGAS